MKLTIDTTTSTLQLVDGDRVTELGLYSREAFEALSRQWVRVGWGMKYHYTFSWMGRPVIQLPEDMIRAQEVIYRLQPDVIVETGIAHGGSLIYYASLCKAIGKGRIVGVDIEIRPHNRKAIESHPLNSYLTLIEGDSTAGSIVDQVAREVEGAKCVLVLLDSNHTKDHVTKELEAYHRFVTPGSYIVATDGIMYDLADAPRGAADWTWNHPAAAAEDFVQSHPEFTIEQPAWPFNESELGTNITHWPSAWIRRR